MRVGWVWWRMALECRRQMSWLFVLSPPRALQTSHYKTESTQGEVATGQHRAVGRALASLRDTLRRAACAPEEGSPIGWPPTMASGQYSVFFFLIQFLPRSQQQVEKGQNWLQTRILLILIVKRRFKNRSGVTPTLSSQLNCLPDPLSYSSLPTGFPRAPFLRSGGHFSPEHPCNVHVGVGGYRRPLSCLIYSLFIPITTAFPLPTSQVTFRVVQCAILGLISFLQSVCGFYLSFF